MPKTLFRSETTKFMYCESPAGSGHNMLLVKNAKLHTRDFSGSWSKYGTKSICVEIPEEIKDLLLNDRWDIRVSIPKDERYDPVYYLPVEILFNELGPDIVKTAPDEPVTYSESTVGKLDKIDMTDIYLVINPSQKKKDKPTAKAYLNKMRFTLNKSPIEYLYEDDDEDEEIPLF